MHPQHLIILLYDSVTNSVFESQVLKPYHAFVTSGLYATMTIITYEKQGFQKTAAHHTFLEQLRNQAPTVTFHILERPLFLGLFSLWPLIKPLRTVLDTYPRHVLIARGPISGYLARHAASTQTQRLTLQARGLLYEEYCMTTKQAPWWSKPFHAYRAHQYRHVEKQAYSGSSNTTCTIESVSPALTTYLATHYQPATPITLATHDTPPLLSPSERLQARAHYRTTLHIDHSAPVYVYNGSLKSWQCPDATFRFFKEQWVKNPQSILLFISQDLHQAQILGSSYQIPTTALRYLTVPHHQVIPLLCAADYGLLFREPHVVNWTSRPTKLLEYQSAGLHIIHNNTIDILQNAPNSSYAGIDYYHKEKE